jgi:hypothetical protein
MSNRRLRGILDYIRESGNRLDLLRLERALQGRVSKNRATKALSGYQFDDGSWDYSSAEEEESRTGSLGGTIHCMRWLREFGLEDAMLTEKTLTFIRSIQDADGSFYEIPRKLEHSPQEWLQSDSDIDRFYFTAAVPMRLVSFSHGNHPLINAAVDWLSTRWHDRELVSATWYNTWSLLCLYPDRAEIDKDTIQYCREKTLGWLPTLGVRPLTWLLDSMVAAGLPRSHDVTQRGLDVLLRLLSRRDSWGNFLTTETAITAFRLCHELDCSDCEGANGTDRLI